MKHLFLSLALCAVLLPPGISEAKKGKGKGNGGGKGKSAERGHPASKKSDKSHPGRGNSGKPAKVKTSHPGRGKGKPNDRGKDLAKVLEKTAREQHKQVEKVARDFAKSNRGDRGKLDAATARLLDDRGRDWDRSRYEKRGPHFDNDNDAARLIESVLGRNAAGALLDRDHHHDTHHGRRLPPGLVGRSDRDRHDSVDYLVRRLAGLAGIADAPAGYFHDRSSYYDERYPDRHRYYRDRDRRDHDHHPHYFHGNRRVVYYRSYSAIPAILLAASRLSNLVGYSPYYESPYRYGNGESGMPRNDGYYRSLPQDYRDEEAYALSYAVNPDTLVSRDDILFQQGETSLADAYSYDIIVDLAEAMNSEELQGETFIVEGHASAEGSYGNNLSLSQARAERICRDLVAMGIDSRRLIPVGYGEAEAEYAASAPEELRSLDRRVLVFTAAEQ